MTILSDEQATTVDDPPSSAPPSAEVAPIKDEDALYPTEATTTEVEYNFGEGLDADTLGKYTPVFKELGLNQEQAQKLVDLRKAELESETNSFNEIREGWVKSAKEDKEMGGQKFSETVSNAQQAIAKYGTPELKAVFDQYGIGDHPEMIRFAAKVGALMREDKVESGSPASNNSNDLIFLYPNDKPKA